MAYTEKDYLIRSIKDLMNNKVMNNRSRSYQSPDMYEFLDKFFVRLGIITIIGLVGFLLIKTYKKD